jgi:hypothetical protein
MMQMCTKPLFRTIRCIVSVSVESPQKGRFKHMKTGYGAPPPATAKSHADAAIRA